MNDFPRMIYKAGGTEEIHGGRFSTLIVHDADELAAALAGGWSLTTPEALEAPERERLAREAEAARAEDDRVRAAEAEALAQAEREAAARREEAEQQERDRIAAEEQATAASAAAAATATAKQDDTTPPTRDELKQKADELGLTFAGNISNAKLAEMIEAALAGGAKD